MFDDIRYDTRKIRELGIKKLTGIGLSEVDAGNLVDSMLKADMNGVSTHGIRMLPGYVSRIESGQFSLQHPKIVKQTPAFTVLDAQNGIGAVSALEAVHTAINNAKEYGIHAVFAKNCNTYGPAFYYVEKMADEGMIGLTCCNSPAAMPAFNGLQQMIGTNPFAFACPTDTCGSIVLDMATSVVAKSKFESARLNGELLQPGWALDKDGNPTTEPVEAIKGFVLPMAGFKGYGIAMMIDLLSGMLSGAAYLNDVGKFYSKDNKGMNVGQMFVSIDPRIVYGDNFYKDMDAYIYKLRNSKSMPGKLIVIPGDDRKKKKAEADEKGIVLTDDTVNRLEILFGTKLQRQDNVGSSIMNSAF